MEIKHFEIEHLLISAMHKCDNISDAEDLVSDTILAAYEYLSKGKKIDNPRAWLTTVLSHKWNDMLRKRYKQTFIPFDEVVDGYNDEVIEELDIVDEAQELRKEIAYLSKIYREVIVEYYMNGKSVTEISKKLNLPEGTIKSRLYSGREHLKKGLVQMEKYSSQSYKPVRLYIANSGNNGINNEPQSLISDDLIAQNILWLSYDSPKTIEEISRLLGIPTAYIEPIIEKLVAGELMKNNGSRYYTDFIIFSMKEKEQYITQQKQFIKSNYELIWKHIGEGLRSLKEKEFYQRLTFDEKNSMELYFVFFCLDYGFYNMLCHTLYERVDHPYRKDGGRWIAFGEMHLDDFNPMEHLDYMMHCYSGERQYRVNNYGASKMIEMHVYGAEGFPDYPYNRSKDYTFLKNGDDIDVIILKLMYILATDTEPEKLDFNINYLKTIPHLKKCKMLREENDKIKPNIPILNKPDFYEFWKLLNETEEKFSCNEELTLKTIEFLKNKKTKIPNHLTSVPEQKQYQYATSAFLFATIREAIAHGELYDGNYDDDSGETVNQHPCPMVLMID